MRNVPSLTRHFLTVGAIAFAVGGCGQRPGGVSPSIPGLGGATTRLARVVGAARVPGGYAIVHSFLGYDGANPTAPLLDVNGTLYGTTTAGDFGPGEVYRITKKGLEVVHTFGSSGDGNTPEAGLVNVGGSLYGTTEIGGTRGEGTVYKLNLVKTTNNESTIYNFGSHHGDGASPYFGDLVYFNGALYGTTFEGGSYGVGTVFKVTTSGSEKVLHSFVGGKDGLYPYSGLTNVGGVLYGTTSDGGANNAGTVFKITSDGTESVVYSFGDGSSSDGASPDAALLEVGGVLYGTTYNGGSNSLGTVFSVTPDGAEGVMYSFKGGSDGARPFARLLSADGNFYGTTQLGGSGGDGTVFEVNTAGTEHVLHSFTGNHDGATPYASLINVKGVLIGTTEGGGNAHGNGGGCKGCGVIYSLPEP